jgi:hypothetical protein
MTKSSGPSRRPHNPKGGLARQRKAEIRLREIDHPLLQNLSPRQPLPKKKK